MKTQRKQIKLLAEIHRDLTDLFDGCHRIVRSLGPAGAGADTCVALGEVLGTIGKAKALIGRDRDQLTAALVDDKAGDDKAGEDEASDNTPF